MAWQAMNEMEKNHQASKAVSTVIKMSLISRNRFRKSKQTVCSSPEETSAERY
jgi:hypothetical protein